MTDTNEQESIFAILLPEIISMQKFCLSPDVAWLEYEGKTIFKFQQLSDEEDDEEEPAVFGSYMVKACPGVEPCGMREADPESWPSPGRFMKLKCGCQIVCVDWGTEKSGPLVAATTNPELVEWFVNHEMNSAIQLIRAMSGSEG